MQTTPSLVIKFDFPLNFSRKVCLTRATESLDRDLSLKLILQKKNYNEEES